MESLQLNEKEIGSIIAALLSITAFAISTYKGRRSVRKKELKNVTKENSRLEKHIASLTTEMHILRNDRDSLLVRHLQAIQDKNEIERELKIMKRVQELDSMKK